jgi:hypothetical protein
VHAGAPASGMAHAAAAPLHGHAGGNGPAWASCAPQVAAWDVCRPPNASRATRLASSASSGSTAGAAASIAFGAEESEDASPTYRPPQAAQLPVWSVPCSAARSGGGGLSPDGDASSKTRVSRAASGVSTAAFGVSAAACGGYSTVCGASAAVASVAFAGVGAITDPPAPPLSPAAVRPSALPPQAASASTATESVAVCVRRSSWRRRAMVFTLASQSKIGSRCFFCEMRALFAHAHSYTCDASRAKRNSATASAESVTHFA